MSIVVALQSGLHMLYLGQRRSYFSVVNKVPLNKLIFLHFERYAFVCYFVLHLLAIFSLYSYIRLQAKLKGRQNIPLPGVMQFQRRAPALCSTFLHDWGASCCFPGTYLSVNITSERFLHGMLKVSVPVFILLQWEDTIRTFLLSGCVWCQGNKYSKVIRSSNTPAQEQF